MRARRRIARLPKPSERNHAPIRNLADRRHENVELARQLEVLEAVIEEVNITTELFSQHAAEIPIGRYAYGCATHLPREHQRFVAGLREQWRRVVPCTSVSSVD